MLWFYWSLKMQKKILFSQIKHHINCINNGSFFHTVFSPLLYQRQRQKIAKWNWMSCTNQFCSAFWFFDKFIATPNWLVVYILQILWFVIVIVIVVVVAAAAASDHTGLACLSFYTHTHAIFCLLLFELTSLVTQIIRHI